MLMVALFLFVTLFSSTLSLAKDLPDFKRDEPTVDLNELTDYLTNYLELGEAPLVWINEDQQPVSNSIFETPLKRARYYRRYPWKRQNGRNYDPDGYLCSPSREDIFQLLMAIHDARNGNTDRQISFCNRRRPARAVFTNIRFLGKR